jgi:hypothetical protein
MSSVKALENKLGLREVRLKKIIKISKLNEKTI